jgi:hypothetical protein
LELGFAELNRPKAETFWQIVVDYLRRSGVLEG